MDRIESQFSSSSNVHWRIIYKQTLFGGSLDLLQQDRKDPRIRFCHLHLARDDNFIEPAEKFKPGGYGGKLLDRPVAQCVEPVIILAQRSQNIYCRLDSARN